MHLCYICTDNPALGTRLSDTIGAQRPDWTCTVFTASEDLTESLTRSVPDMILVGESCRSPALMRELRQLPPHIWVILIGGKPETGMPRLPAKFQTDDLSYFLNNSPDGCSGNQILSIRKDDKITSILLRHIWTGLLNHWLRAEHTMIQMAAQGVGLNGLENMHVLPILVKTIHQRKADTTKEQSSLDHIFFDQLFSDYILGETHQGDMMDRFEQKWAVLLYIEDTPIPAGALQKRCREAAGRAAREGWQLGFVIGAPVLPEELPAQWERLEELARSDVGGRAFLQSLQDTPRGTETFALPDMSPWGRLMEAGEFLSAAEAVRTSISELAEEQELTTQWLLQFRNAFCEELYKAIHVHGIPVEDIFRQESTEDSAFNRAPVSIQQTLAWVDMIMKAMEQSRLRTKSDSVVQQAQKYILQHLDQNLSREEIAKNVFVSRGYLGRLFKKELHMNLSEYIFTERMKVAQQMLEQTDLYVTTIAMNVGYSNFPYFSTQFKQYSGYSPLEYRKLHR